MKNVFVVIFLLALNPLMYGQEEMTLDKLMQEKEALSARLTSLQDQVEPLEKQISDLDNKILNLQGWRTGAFGTLGFNQSTFNNWIKGANPNAVSSSITAVLNGFANKKTEKFFWRNSGVLNLGWQKLDTNTEVDEEGEVEGYQRVADVLRITSLYGRNLTSKLALSSMGDYNTAILSNFNNPGILDIGAGITYNPTNNLVIVAHPINYHWVFGDQPQFSSALGAKVGIDYVQTFPNGITYRSNFAGFLPYSSQDPSPSLREYTWTNGIAFSAWKGIGVGIEYALRDAAVEFDGRQSYLVIGLSYAIQ